MSTRINVQGNYEYNQKQSTQVINEETMTIINVNTISEQEECCEGFLLKRKVKES